MGVPKPMTHYPYILFNQTPDTLRRIGGRGGKAQARNRRARRTTLPAPTVAGSAPLSDSLRQGSENRRFHFLVKSASIVALTESAD